MSRDVFTLVEPDVPKAGLIVNSAHSGRLYLGSFVQSSQLSLTSLRSSEDAYVDQLFDAAPALGVPMLSAVMPRAYVDLNRASDELDPAVIEGLRRSNVSPRIASGLGVIPRVVAEGREIRRGKMSLMNAKTRLARYYWPYHQELVHLMDVTRNSFGSALLLDCHSMPSQSGDVGAIGYDIILGDRFGASCSGEYVDVLESLFADVGFRVGRNAPFAGAFIAQRYGAPSSGHHVIQIEVNRGLYLDEREIKPKAEFASVKRKLTSVLEQMIAFMRPQIGLAAE